VFFYAARAKNVVLTLDALPNKPTPAHRWRQ
jgi:hypothetical protein